MRPKVIVDNFFYSQPFVDSQRNRKQSGRDRWRAGPKRQPLVAYVYSRPTIDRLNLTKSYLEIVAELADTLVPTTAKLSGYGCPG